MNVMLTWVLGAVILIVLLAVFLWLAKNRQKKPASLSPKVPDAPREEYAEEIAFPVPAFQPKPAVKPETPEIPWHYGMDRMVLMVRDPSWIFAYWEISATKQEEFARQYGPDAWNNSRSVLRVYDVTGIEHFTGLNANNYMDISINDEVDSWHIDVSRPNSAFCVDLGRLFPDGTFITLLRSNIVQTPSVSISNLLDEEWMWIEGIYRSITHLHMGSSPMMAEEIAQGMGLVPLGISSPGYISSTGFAAGKE
ncbi:DUF4912 domain-containing protein [Desulfoscipio geothermicus]|uniref:DUF4912 domain-containing protein n=1 Tax=Desulfoscipio geothermicus DSM 3669 TaxID=1121426 RepID=A0A1I6CVR7_9FIRM|nr:DUF4912 domain-containing protein [Desulfoscipio geothermicus]SFQ97365.1 hypothetical protein SAMN05660706_102167 [Desulfoscipio geothermicus DSM 3669]